LLSVEGQVCLTEAFFEHLEQNLASVVKSAIAEGLEEIRKAQVEQAPSPRGGSGAETTDSGLHLAADEPRRASMALSRIGIDLGTKEGQGMVDIKMLARFLDISPRAIYRLVAVGAIPKPVAIGKTLKRWHLEEILAWVHDGCAPAAKWQRIREIAMRRYRTWSTSGGK